MTDDDTPSTGDLAEALARHRDLGPAEREAPDSDAPPMTDTTTPEAGIADAGERWHTVESGMNREWAARTWASMPLDTREVFAKRAARFAALTPPPAGQPNAPVAGEVEMLREALAYIAAWKLPPTGKFWDEPENTRPMSYGACFGSNGERDHMREVARRALSTPAQPNARAGDAVRDYAALGRSCEAHGLARFSETGEMLFQPPAEMIAEQVAEAALAGQTAPAGDEVRKVLEELRDWHNNRAQRYGDRKDNERASVHRRWVRGLSAALAAVPTPSTRAMDYGEHHNGWQLGEYDATPSTPDAAGTVEGEVRAKVRAIVDDAMNSAIPEPWEVSERATDRIMRLFPILLSKEVAS